MAMVINQFIKWYTYLFTDLADPRVNHLPLMSTPWTVLALLGFYLYFVLSFGPNFMKNRQPFKLDIIFQIYNILHVIISVYLFIEMAYVWFTRFNFICQPLNTSNTPNAMKEAMLIWYYLLNKLYDLLDTIFLVLKKKQTKVTFLHVYHHMGMVIVSWIALKYVPGGHGTFTGLINTFVHVIMYLYYQLTLMKLNVSHWKKYITQLQMIQFVLIIIHSAQVFWVNCDYPKWPMIMIIPQQLFLVLLFCDFYYKMYIIKNLKQDAALSKNEKFSINANIVNEKSKEQ